MVGEREEKRERERDVVRKWRCGMWDNGQILVDKLKARHTLRDTAKHVSAIANRELAVSRGIHVDVAPSRAEFIMSIHYRPASRVLSCPKRSGAIGRVRDLSIPDSHRSAPCPTQGSSR